MQTIKSKLVRKQFFKAGLFLVVLLLFSFYPLSLSPSYVSRAQAQDAACIGTHLADYAATVFDQLGTKSYTGEKGEVRFLSPAFNMTNAGFSSLVENFNRGLQNSTERGYENNYSLEDFSFIAGNAYNVKGDQRISQYIADARNTAIGDQPIILTETGWYPHGTNKNVDLLRDEIKGADIKGALIFNVFGNNPEFSDQKMNDDEIEAVCEGNCKTANIGANSAVYYYNQPDFYQDAHRNNMKYTLEIANKGDALGSVKAGIRCAHGVKEGCKDYNMIPIVRLGVGSNSGGFYPPSNLVDFIQKLADNIQGEMYVIIGSNEPLTECWATPQCKCGAPGEFTPRQVLTGKPWPEDPSHFYIPKKGNKELLSKIRNRIVRRLPIVGPTPSPGRTPPQVPPAEVPDIDSDKLSLAQRASQASGVRASLTLAVMNNESSFIRIPQTGCYFCDQLCSEHIIGDCSGCESCGSTGNEFCIYTNPIQCQKFNQVWNDVEAAGGIPGYSKFSIPLSCAGVYRGVDHCGGAMGPAQAMPYTWMEFRDEVRRKTGHAHPSPWNFEDALMFIGLKLRDDFAISDACAKSGGASSKTCHGEACSVQSYMGAHEDLAWQIVGMANAIAEEYSGLEEDPCTGSFAEGDWILPIHSPTVLSSNAQDHIDRGDADAIAWDLTAECERNVYAAKEGRVAAVSCNNLRGFGCRVELNHENDQGQIEYRTLYGHLKSGRIKVSINESVSANEPIGEVGCTGTTTFGPHVHFGIFHWGGLVDPKNVYGEPGTIGLNHNEFCYSEGCPTQTCTQNCACTGDPNEYCW